MSWEASSRAVTPSAGQALFTTGSSRRRAAPRISRSSQKIKVSMRINTRGGGNAFPGWSKENASAEPGIFVFLRENMKKSKNPNLKQAVSVTFGFGLWQYDTTKFPLEIEIRNAEVIRSAAGTPSK